MPSSGAKSLAFRLSCGAVLTHGMLLALATQPDEGSTTIGLATHGL